MILHEISLFILGIIIGSFLNVCIYRLPLNQSIAWPASHCMKCGKSLKIKDLIPVLSYILLGGKCRYCGIRISLRYVVIEISTAILFVWCFKIIGLEIELLKSIAFTAFLIVITLIDYDQQLILDKLLIWFAGFGFFINLFFIDNMDVFFSRGIFTFPYICLLDMLFGVVLGGGLLLLIAIISRGGMGGGDIKFAAALGLWLGWKLTLLTLLISFILGGLIGVLLLLFKLKDRKDFIPFGPFIAGGAFIAMLYGNNIIKWYLNTL